MNDAPNSPIAMELEDVLSAALRAWSDKRYLQADGSTIIPAIEVDHLMNGMINFMGINIALIHKSLLHLLVESPTTFNYQMAHKYAEHFMTIFLNNLEIKEDERTS